MMKRIVVFVRSELVRRHEASQESLKTEANVLDGRIDALSKEMNELFFCNWSGRHAQIGRLWLERDGLQERRDAINRKLDPIQEYPSLPGVHFD